MSEFDAGKHPRDTGGRWANTPGQPALDEEARRIKLAADSVAAALDYDPSLISINTGEKKFTLNGKQYDYAGAAYLETGKIELYSKQLSPSSIAPTTAHEIGHQKFQRFTNDYQAEYKRMSDETANIDVDTYMKPNGLLREGYAEKYPLYQKWTEVMQPSILEDFAKTDGITEYSKEWWKAWHAKTANTSQAMHETIAEMTAREYMEGPDYEDEVGKFKEAGYSLDASFGSFKRPTAYKVRKWKGGPESVDENALPPSLRSSLTKLRESATQKSERLSPPLYGTPAKEWVALYNAINEHWQTVKNTSKVQP